jgi:hypothetical protein
LRLLLRRTLRGRAVAITIAGAAFVAAPTGSPADGSSEALSVRHVGAAIEGGETTLTAAARGPSRVACATFIVDGRVAGSDSTPPFRLEAETAGVGPGSHTLRVVVVDTGGRRAVSNTYRVVVRRSARKVIVAGPAELGRARQALARGRVTVRLRPGRYVVDRLDLGDGARLLGAGRGTVIAAAPETSYWGLVVAWGRGIRIADLTIDGGGSGPGIGHAVVVQNGAHDVRLQRVRIRDVRKVGVFAWGAYSDVSVQDSVISGSAQADAGVIAGESGTYGVSRDSSVIRSRISGFRSFGVLFAHQAHGRLDAAVNALALDNRISEIVDPRRSLCRAQPTAAGCGTSEGGIWSGSRGAAIIGNRVWNTGWDGIQTIGSSTRVSVLANRISGTRTGIYLEHATNHSVIARNVVSRVGTAITVEWEYGGVSSRYNRFEANVVQGATTAGFLISIGADGNQIVGNDFRHVTGPAVVLHGSSGNTIRHNSRCGRGVVVDQRPGIREDGTAVTPSGNDIHGNSVSTRCR